MYIILLSILCILCVALATIPFLGSKNYFLGIKVSDEFYTSKRYKQILIIYELFVLIPFIIGVLMTVTNSNYSVLSVIFICISSFLGYIITHIMTKKSEHSNITHEEVVRSKIDNVTISSLYYIINFVLIVVFSMYIYVLYTTIDDTVPYKFNFNAEVVLYGDKNTLIIVMLLIMVLLTILFIFINKVLNKTKYEVINQEVTKKFVKKTSIIILLLSNLIILVIVSAVLLSFNIITFGVFNIIILSFLLTILACVIMLIVFQLQKNKNSIEVRSDDQDNWLLGIIYYNKKDSAIFVEKRVGIGWTINMANKIVQLVIGFIVILIVVLIILFI